MSNVHVSPQFMHVTYVGDYYSMTSYAQYVKKYRLYMYMWYIYYSIKFKISLHYEQFVNVTAQLYFVVVKQGKHLLYE